MFKLVLAFYITWQLFVMTYQFSEPLRRAIGTLAFHLCGLLPSWRLFGPQPVDGDFRLFYRIRSGPSTAFSDWQPLPAPGRAPLVTQFFFNPPAHRAKALRDLCVEVNAARSHKDVYYQLLLQHVLIQVKRLKAGGREFQFRIGWQTPDALQSTYESYVHEC